MNFSLDEVVKNTVQYKSLIYNRHYRKIQKQKLKIISIFHFNEQNRITSKKLGMTKSRKSIIQSK